MGKRELLLIVGFLIAGAVVYQATAPPAPASDSGFSIGGLIDMARREIRGNPASVKTTTGATHALTADITELRVIGTVGELRIVGESRPDVESTLLVNSSAYNDDEARQYAEATTLNVEETGFGLTMRIEYPEGRHTGRQRAVLAIRVPSRLRVRVESRTSELEVRNVAGMEVSEARGRTQVRNVSGRVTLRQRGGSASIEEVDAVKVTARGSDIAIAGVRGDATIAMESGGSLKVSGVTGPLDVDARNAEVTLEGLEATPGPVRVNAVNGSVVMHGISTEVRVEGRDTELDLTMARAAAATVYNEGEDVALTLPPGGYRLDLAASEGTIEPADVVAELGLELVAAGREESRVTGAVKDGGPVIAVRTTRGDLTLRPPADGKAATDSH